MAVDDVIVRAGPVAVPLDYKVPTGTEIIPRSISASINGAGAAGAFVPVLEIIAPNGSVTAYCARRLSFAAGASVLVSWFPGVAEADDESSSSTGGGTISKLVSPLGTLAVASPQGPTASLDLAASGVTAGSYGDGTHVATLTVDANGRLTAASNIALSTSPGGIIAFGTTTANVTAAGTTFGTGTDILAADLSFVADGVSSYAVAVSASVLQNNGVAGTATRLNIKLDGADGGKFGEETDLSPNSATPLHARGIIVTPAAGAHTVNVRMWVSGSTAQMQGGVGGVGNVDPILVTVELL